MIALVTGSSGFIGSHLVSRLEADGHRVRRLVRAPGSRGTSAKTERTMVDFDRPDLGVDPSALVDAELVFHAAGVTRAVDERTFVRANANATRNLLSALVTAGARPERVVLISSQAAAGPAQSRDRPVTENDARPIDPYGRSKLEAERHVASFGDRMPYTIVRPSAVYGPGDRDFLTIFRMVRLGVAVYPANRDSWLSVVHVMDLVDGVVRAALAPGGGHTFFIANDDAIRWRDVYAAVAKAMNKSRPIELDVPAPLLDVAARIGDLAAAFTGRASLVTTNKVLLGKQPYWICSNALAKRTLGWAPRIPLAEGMRQTLDAYSRQRWL